jgi:hypothetical protein
VAEMAFKGSSRSSSRPQRIQFLCSVPSHGCKHLGTFNTDQAASGARLYDAAQLLIRGPRSDINFEWSSYSQADVQRAVDLLQAKGVDVHRAVVAAREGQRGNAWFGAQAQGATWYAHVNDSSGQQLSMVWWCGLPSAEAAARQADCGLLAVKGMQCNFTNFPASAYSQLQLQQAGEHAISKGVEAALVKKNLEAVEKVRECAPHPFVARVEGVVIIYTHFTRTLLHVDASHGLRLGLLASRSMHADRGMPASLAWNTSRRLFLLLVSWNVPNAAAQIPAGCLRTVIGVAYPSHRCFVLRTPLLTPCC